MCPGLLGNPSMAPGVKIGGAGNQSFAKSQSPSVAAPKHSDNRGEVTLPSSTLALSLSQSPHSPAPARAISLSSLPFPSQNQSFFFLLGVHPRLVCCLSGGPHLSCPPGSCVGHLVTPGQTLRVLILIPGPFQPTLMPLDPQRGCLSPKSK